MKTIYDFIKNPRSGVMLSIDFASALGMFHADLLKRIRFLINRNPSIKKEFELVAVTRATNQNFCAYKITPTGAKILVNKLRNKQAKAIKEALNVPGENSALLYPFPQNLAFIWEYATIPISENGIRGFATFLDVPHELCGQLKEAILSQMSNHYKQLPKYIKHFEVWILRESIPELKRIEPPHFDGVLQIISESESRKMGKFKAFCGSFLRVNR